MKPCLRTTLSSLTLSAAMLTALPATAADVVTSIKPLQLITSALTAGVTEPELLLPAEGTPHHYSLKPSDMRKLTEAKVLVWVGPGLEQFLQKPLSRTEAQIVTLLPDSKPHSHGADADDHADEHEHDEHGHESEEHDHDEHEHDEHGHEEAHEEHSHEHHEDAHADAGHDEHEHEAEEHHSHADGDDPHIWLDPLNAIAIADQIMPALLETFPNQVDQLEANRNAFEQAVRAKEADLAAQMASVKDSGFFVFHDAYSGFVNHYGMNQLGYFTVDPARKPGARHLAEIREQLEQSQAVCVFSEPQFTSAVVHAIVGDLPVQLGELDPLARDIEPGQDAYIRYLTSLGNAFEACLTKKD